MRQQGKKDSKVGPTIPLNILRIEYDAYRTDLEFYGAAGNTEANQLKLAETQVSFNNKKLEFEKLRSDVQIKLKFLDENRVSKTINLDQVSKPILFR